MRELQLLDNSDGIDDSFSDIQELSNKCKFSNCNHNTEPGCAVKEAIESGTLSLDRFNSYKKLKKEALFMESKINKALKSEKKKEFIKINKSQRKNKDIF
ncbi:putative ribosome biogenesis GTPase RsgA [compost metagenome]